jgi:hypothetical protein
MDDAPLTAIHGIEPEGSTAMLHPLGGRERAQAQFFHAEQTVIVRIERESRVIVGRQPKHLHREMFQGKQKLGAVGQEQIHIGAVESHDYIGGLEIVRARIGVSHFKAQLKPRLFQNRCQELFEFGSDIRNRVFPGARHVYFLPFRLGAGGAISAGVAVLLKINCWAIPIKFPVNQYNTSPLATQ